MECPADVYVRMYKQASVQDKGDWGMHPQEFF